MPARSPASCGASAAASRRASMKPDAQAGAPGHAAMRRRGSPAHTTKPSRSTAVVSASAFSEETPISISARSGTGQIDRAPWMDARRASSAIAPAWAWPKASAIPSASDPSRRRWRPIISAGGRRGGIAAGSIRNCERSAPMPWERSKSAARGPRAAISRRSPSTTSTARSGAIGAEHAQALLLPFFRGRVGEGVR